jgi:Tfp pilus assembly protein PilN
MRAVNLLPRDVRRGSGLSLGGHAGAAPLAAAGGVALGTVVAVTAAFVVVHARATSEQKKLASARAQLTQVTAARSQTTPAAPAKTTPIVPVPAVTQELQPRLDALSTAMASRIAWDRVLREFSLVVPSDVTVSALTLNTGFSLTGTAFSQDSVARLLSRLGLIPDLSGVALQNSSADATSGLVTFSISAALKPAAPSAVTGA